MTPTTTASFLYGLFAMIGLSVMLAAGIAVVGWLIQVACNYTWQKLLAAHDLALLTREIRRLGKAGRMWWAKPMVPEDVQ